MLNYYLIFKKRKAKAIPSCLVLFFALILATSVTAFGQTKTITGVITDAKTGEPLVGAAVKVTTSQVSTSADGNGKFTLVVPTNASVVITYIGYDAQTIAVGNQTQLTIKLEPNATALSQVEIVGVGYGTMRKKDLTGAITQIRPDKIADQNPNTVQDILRGTAGVSVGLDASAKGGGSIQIRGIRSVYSAGGHNDPLLILDGTIFYGELSEINPDDIEQMDILKDASASAVYGAKSANGVIIITTKKGKIGKPKINFTSNAGFVTSAADREVFDGAGYIKYREDWYTAPTYGVNTTTGKYEAYQSTFKTQPGYYASAADAVSKYGATVAQWRAYTTNTTGSSDNEIFGKRLLLQSTVLNNFLAGQTFNWYDHSFQTGTNQDYNISASGATDKMNYYFSMGYLSNKGVAVGNEYSAIRGNLKLDANITKWLQVGANVNFQDRTDGDLAVDWSRQILNNSPFANYKDANGNLVVHPMGDNMVNNYGYNYDFNRLYLDLDKGYTVLNTILNAKVKLPFGINYSFNASPRYQYFHDRYWESASHPDWKGTNGLVNREQAKRFDWSINNTLNWERTFAEKHRVAITLVQEAEKRQYWQDRIEARNILPSDALGFHETLFGDKQLSRFDSNDTKETADGLLGRLFYSYNDRYMLTTSVRRDGYSAFGASNPRATFFSAAVAWTFTNESFFKWKAMSTGKLRMSWGQNGNRQLGDPYLALANLGLGAGATAGYIDNSGNLIQYRYLLMDRLANPALTWEKTEAFNAGLDFGFLDNRISGSIDYYITPTIDMIMTRSLPDFTGFPSINTNLGKVENRGFELSINSQNIKHKDFSWSTTFQISKYKNTIKHLYYVYDNIIDANGNVTSTKERDDIGNGWFIGQPIGAIWNYRVTGIWQANEVTEAAKYGQRPGDPKVANNYTADDNNGVPVYNDKDKEFLGQTNPPIMWSLRNDFNYKNFNFSFNMYSYMGHKSLNGAYLNQDNGTSLVTNLANTWEKNYWTLENPTNDFARLDARGPAGVSAPGMLYDRSFIRLENVTLGYTLPNKLTSKLGIEKLKVYSSVRNVAVWTKDKNWEYWDVETGALAPRIYTFGLNVNF
ncbi:SusC/RagA family TonB-linked outer membrane protein [Pedobacter frigiditerrae]|uniref:SusC/RagA family TonB-linked outer membrane protein n=1 Tax=Pedobacter frigiditerrae TaxID=2530452 RepID=A0A4R0MKZ5_9SPHI|nr:SusC/RagA family TonB-linked outer membrane protein [Pedobacter frigiditerrae]TCC87308.1 SusC/RagA family TonB-linked outer membrane protein [Pedobacter frigiditerrae]